MNSFLLAPPNLPFAVAGVLVLVLGLLELAGLLMAVSVSHLLESIVPDFDPSSPLGWLHFGRVPLLILLILLLASFAIVGYGVQTAAFGVSGMLLPSPVATAAAGVASMFCVRVFGGMLERVLPYDETASVSEQSFIGRIARISGGTAKTGMAAQARVRDAHGRQHFVMVEPDIAGEEYREGDEVLIVAKSGPFYRCIANPHPQHF